MKTYPGNTFRLETPHPSKDGQLYEGVRYAWLCFAIDCSWTGGDARPRPLTAPPSNIKPWRLTALRLVTNFQPVSYTGSFTSSDQRLEKIWYTGAYPVDHVAQTWMCLSLSLYVCLCLSLYRSLVVSLLYVSLSTSVPRACATCAYPYPCLLCPCMSDYASEGTTTALYATSCRLCTHSTLPLYRATSATTS